jgi:ubiquinone/menaquinone biosynthesis C-methylase UbiE
MRILDLGCGEGNQLRQFVQWGATPANLAGIDLRENAVRRAAELAPGMDVRAGSAAALPWADASFDVVCQHTVFTSILDGAVRRNVAAEMTRVLRPGGAVLWYDFVYDNPSNPDVRGVPMREVRALFSGFAADLRRVTLAPPIARRLPVGALALLYPLLAALPFFRTHCLGVLVKPH